MKKKKEEPVSIFKRKGFYVALYSCVGVVLMAAAIITYYNNNSAPVPNEQIAELNVEEPESITTSRSRDQSYAAIATPTPRPSYSAPVIVYDTYDDQAVDADLYAYTPPQVSSPQASVKEETAEPEQKVIYAEPIVDNPSDGYLISSTQNQELINEIAENIDDTQAVFNTFTSGNAMSWPVTGAIVMDYKADGMVYDTTLEHFRSNKSISIEATVGTQVKSAADGIVSQIYKTIEDGNVVVVDHGNGWQTTYSQLQNTLLVAAGDVISEGQVIGGVASPSNHSIMLGSHLEFAVTKDNESTDPKDVLK